jgi:peroxiredoxin
MVSFLKSGVVYTALLIGANTALAGDAATLAGLREGDMRALVVHADPEAVPQIDLADATGAAVRLSDFGGRVVVLNFWATWCPPCIEEMPELAELHREIARSNGAVIGIGIDSPSNVREFASKHQFPYPLLVGGMGGTELSRRFGNSSGALPFTIVIAPDGRIVKRILGRVRLAQLRDLVRPILR